MATYQALYRKYRPQTFDDVVGQLAVTQTLKTQLARRQKELADRDREIGILNSNLCGYVQLVNQKEKQLIALERLREMHQQQIALLQQQLQEQLLINQQSFATRIIRATKNCIKRILRIMGRKVNQ